MVESNHEVKLPQAWLFPNIFRTFRTAFSFSNMIIAFLAVAVICIAGWLMDRTKSVVVSTGGADELQVYVAKPQTLDSFIEHNKDSGERKGVYSTLWSFAAPEFQQAVAATMNLRPTEAAEHVVQYFRAIFWSIRYHPIYCIIFSMIKLIIVCVAGGAICRIAALQFAKGEKPGISEALRYSTSKFISFLAAPLMPLAISIFLALLIVVLGLIGNIGGGVGNILMALGILGAAIVAAVITIVLIGTVGGFNLMFPALAFDGLDCFDAISRSFNYVYSRPWRMVFYTSVAAVYGSICYMFTRLFAFILLFVTHFSLTAGLFGKGQDRLAATWPEPQLMNLAGVATASPSGWTQWFAWGLTHLFVLIVIGLVMAFVFSFYFSANTIIYSLLRNRVDNTPLDEIHTVSEKIDTATIEDAAKKQNKDKKK